MDGKQTNSHVFMLSIFAVCVEENEGWGQSVSAANGNEATTINGLVIHD